MLITFGTIVKNGMPFIKYSIESVYQSDCEIIVVDGGSTDGTIKWVLSNDPKKKIKMVCGVWNDKVDQSNEYLKRAKGKWVWQLDSDEVYHLESIKQAEEFLKTADQEYYNVPILNFWRNIHTVVKGGLWLEPFIRVWRHYEGDIFINHRPPQIRRKDGRILTSNHYKNIMPEILMYHYSHIGIDRVKVKAEYFSKVLSNHPVYSEYMKWYKDVYLDLSRVNSLHITGGGEQSKFKGEHPYPVRRAIANKELTKYECWG